MCAARISLTPQGYRNGIPRASGPVRRALTQIGESVAIVLIDLVGLFHLEPGDPDQCSVVARAEAVANGHDVPDGDTRIYDAAAAEEAAYAENSVPTRRLKYERASSSKYP